MKRLAVFLFGLCCSARLLHADCTLTNLGITPLPDLGLGTYKNFTGGLYANGTNTRPPPHEAAGLRIANQEIVPRDAAGNVDTNNGKIVMISVGMSNTTDEFSRLGPSTFKPRADADLSKNPQLVIVDGAQGGRDSVQWTNINSTTWSTIDAILTSQRYRVTTQQVQIAWIKQARGRPSDYGAFPAHARVLQDNLEMIARALKVRYPNIKLVYLSSRTRAYVELTTGGLNPEPYAYESSFSVKWAIENQLDGALHLNFDPAKGRWWHPIFAGGRISGLTACSPARTGSPGCARICGTTSPILQPMVQRKSPTSFWLFSKPTRRPHRGSCAKWWWVSRRFVGPLPISPAVQSRSV
jgi:hypothetical protein